MNRHIAGKVVERELSELQVDRDWERRMLDNVPARNILQKIEKDYGIKRDEVLEFLYFFCKPPNRVAIRSFDREVSRRRRQATTIIRHIRRLRKSIRVVEKEGAKSYTEAYWLGLLPMIFECNNLAALSASLDQFEIEVEEVLAELKAKRTSSDHRLATFAGQLQTRTGTRRMELIERLVAYADEAFGNPYRSKDPHSKLRKKIERYSRDPRNT